MACSPVCLSLRLHDHWGCDANTSMVIAHTQAVFARAPRCSHGRRRAQAGNSLRRNRSAIKLPVFFPFTILTNRLPHPSIEEGDLPIGMEPMPSPLQDGKAGMVVAGEAVHRLAGHDIIVPAVEDLRGDVPRYRMLPDKTQVLPR